MNSVYLSLICVIISHGGQSCKIKLKRMESGSALMNVQKNPETKQWTTTLTDDINDAEFYAVLLDEDYKQFDEFGGKVCNLSSDIQGMVANVIITTLGLSDCHLRRGMYVSEEETEVDDGLCSHLIQKDGETSMAIVTNLLDGENILASLEISVEVD